MNPIIVPSSTHNYPVSIGSGLLQTLGATVKRAAAPAIPVIVTDSNVEKLYRSAAVESLRMAGFSEVPTFVIPAGEESKNSQTWLELLRFLAQNRIGRKDCLIALGGGVVGDLTGFAAAVYLRGIACIQVPTSLLAAVDSSVGGKTAIDLPEGKNLVGAFYPPRAVLCDTAALATLPPQIFCDGCAEVIKYAVLFDPELFAHLVQHGMAFDRETVIARCVSWKRDVVSADEFDTGARMKLNLGHTVGHAVELLSHFTVSHGQAVAIGMAITARAACRKGFCSQQTADAIESVLQQFHLPIQTQYSAAQLYSAALSDKKRLADTVNLVVPQAIGSCSLLPVPLSCLEAWIEAGL